MRDRFAAGAISGMIGSFVQIMYGFITVGLNITDRSFEDFAKIFIMYRNYTGILAFLVGFIAQIVLGALLGIIFAYIIKKTSPDFYYFKGIGYGLFIWVSLGIIGTIYKLPLFHEIPPGPALVTLVGGIIYGWVTSFCFKFINQRSKLR